MAHKHTTKKSAPAKAPTPGCEFAILDIKAGRDTLKKILDSGAGLPVKIEGVINDVWGGDDGVSREFSLRVTKLTPLAPVLPFARVDDLKAGDHVIVDGGFTCMPEFGHRAVKKKPNGELYITCTDGCHFLDGQIDGMNKFYVGIYKLPAGRK